MGRLSHVFSLLFCTLIGVFEEFLAIDLHIRFFLITFALGTKTN